MGIDEENNESSERYLHIFGVNNFTTGFTSASKMTNKLCSHMEK